MGLLGVNNFTLVLNCVLTYAHHRARLRAITRVQKRCIAREVCPYLRVRVNHVPQPFLEHLISRTVMCVNPDTES